MKFYIKTRPALRFVDEVRIHTQHTVRTRAYAYSGYISLNSDYRYVSKFVVSSVATDPLCGLVVRVSGYRPRGPGFDSQRFQIF
jgi:hypothetical protein